MKISTKAVDLLAKTIVGKEKLSRKTWNDRLSSFFVIHSDVISELWGLLEDNGIPYGFRPIHLLWTLHFLKSYGNESVISKVCNNCHEDTLRTWVWVGIYLISKLDLIDWEARFMNNNGSICLVTVDGTDFRICEPKPFNPIWFSHKFNGPGVRYEIGICIQTGWIVWINGAYPCGIPDLSIARHWINEMLEDGEMYQADGGYCDGQQYSMTPNGRHDLDQYMKSVARARHEAVNGWFKRFGILQNRYRHKLSTHYYVFHAVANITQLLIMMGHTPFDVEYRDN